MKVSLKQAQWHDCVPLFLVATLFFIPISTTFKSIFISLSIIGILLTPIYRRDIPYSFSQYWSKAAIALFIVMAMACLWSSADYHTCLVFIKKYSKLLYLPILAVGFSSPKVRMWGIYAFLLAMLLTCIMSLMSPIYLLKGSYDPGEVFHNHIVTSFMMAFAAYLSAFLMARQVGLKRIGFLLLMLLYSYQVIFVNTGRAGYLIYFVLMLMFLIQHLPMKHIAAGVLGFCVLFALVGYHSAVVSTGLHGIVADYEHYQQGQKKTSVGYRLMFHQYAKSLFLAKPWIGNGTGGYSHAFRKTNTFPEWSNLLDPHSQYWLVAAESGLLGLTTLFAFLACLCIAALRLGKMKPVMFGLLVSFVLGNITDSLLLYSVVGNLFIVFSALCMGELVERRVISVDQNTSDAYVGKPV